MNVLHLVITDYDRVEITRRILEEEKVKGTSVTKYQEQKHKDGHHFFITVGSYSDCFYLGERMGSAFRYCDILKHKT